MNLNDSHNEPGGALSAAATQNDFKTAPKTLMVWASNLGMGVVVPVGPNNVITSSDSVKLATRREAVAREGEAHFAPLAVLRMKGKEGLRARESYGRVLLGVIRPIDMTYPGYNL